MRIGHTIEQRGTHRHRGARSTPFRPAHHRRCGGTGQHVGRRERARARARETYFARSQPKHNGPHTLEWTAAWFFLVAPHTLHSGGGTDPAGSFPRPPFPFLTRWIGVRTTRTLSSPGTAAAAAADPSSIFIIFLFALPNTKETNLRSYRYGCNNNRSTFLLAPLKEAFFLSVT